MYAIIRKGMYLFDFNVLFCIHLILMFHFRFRHFIFKSFILTFHFVFGDNELFKLGEVEKSWIDINLTHH